MNKLKTLKALERLNLKRSKEGRSPLAKWMPRKGIIHLCSGCHILINEAGDLDVRSYDWWSIAKVIKGHLFFNAHRYSVTTAKHQSRARSFLDAMGIKVQGELHAPRGLNNDFSLSTTAMEYGALVVKDKSARIKSKYTQKQIALLENSIRLYAKLTKTKGVKQLLADGIRIALEAREKKLAKERLKNQRKRFLAKARGLLGDDQQHILIAEAGPFDASKVGIHLLNPTLDEIQDAINTADRDLFKTIWIHTEQNQTAFNAESRAIHGSVEVKKPQLSLVS